MMAGGGKAKPMAPGMPAILFDIEALMASYCASGSFRLDHSSREMKKKAL
jgi:hypothetical protein